MAARGIPIVATNWGPYADYVQHEVTGLLVDKPHDWARYLTALIHDEQARAEMAAQAYAHAATQTIEDHITEWEKALSC
jgi:glycosyltransferase involved in cell wall biosynthesis